MEFGAISVVLVLIFAFLAGLEGILDSFEFHQPIIACSLIGIATGHIVPGVVLGGALQLIALGWANIGAAVAPDAALASVASAILLVKSDNFTYGNIIGVIIPAAILLATAGLVLTTLVRLLAVVIIHQIDREAEKGNYFGAQLWHVIALVMQGLRIAIPAGFLLFIPSTAVISALHSIPAVVSGGLAVGGGMVVVVGYAMVINLMASREAWPFFIIGFALAPLGALTMIAIGALGIALALIYDHLDNKGGHGGSESDDDPIGDFLNNY